MQTELDLDALRTLVIAMDIGGFARASEQLHRSQSAVSLQMRRLEAQVGQPLFRKDGRRLALTDAGDILLSYARRILELNDEAVAAVRGVSVEGTVRFGVVQDFAETWLTPVLASFARAHPSVHIEVQVDRSTRLVDQVTRGQLDLALAFSGESDLNAIKIALLPMVWIGQASFNLSMLDEVPLILFENPCLCRQASIDALNRAKMGWRIVFTSPSLPGLWAAVEAGLGVTVRTPIGIPNQLKALNSSHGLPALPTVNLFLHSTSTSPSPAVSKLQTILLDALQANLIQCEYNDPKQNC
jgi:DNA-binding transcriptional LysR family regulator